MHRKGTRRIVKEADTEVFVRSGQAHILKPNRSWSNRLRRRNPCVRSAEVTEREGSVLCHLFTIAAMRVNTSSAQMKNARSHRPAFNRKRLHVRSAAVTERT